MITFQWIYKKLERFYASNIKPVYKNNGDSAEPQNYRPGTLLCCLGKLFTAIANESLNKYADKG